MLCRYNSLCLIWLPLVAAYLLQYIAGQSFSDPSFCRSRDPAFSTTRLLVECIDICGEGSYFVFAAGNVPSIGYCIVGCPDGREVAFDDFASCDSALINNNVAAVCQQCSGDGSVPNPAAPSPPSYDDCYGKGTYKHDDVKSGKKKGKVSEKGKKCKTNPKEPHPEKVGKGKGGKGKGYSVDDDYMVEPPVSSIPAPPVPPAPPASGPVDCSTIESGGASCGFNLADCPQFCIDLGCPCG